MGKPMTLVVDALATYRLTRLVTTDRITARARDLVDPASELGYFVRCDWCSSIWIGAAVVAARRVFPRAWGPVACALAFSAVAGITAENV